MSARRRTATAVLVLGALLAAQAAGTHAGAAASPHSGGTTAWHDGSLQANTAGVISRSDLVLQSPPRRPEQSMPLGNGKLGVAAWDDHGFTAQLNRNDTFPNLKSAGQLVVPGLAQLDGARDYKGRLDLYNAELEQSGGGLSARSYVRAGADQFVLDVSGARADTTQTAVLKLWP